MIGQCTVYNVQCTVYSVQCTVYSVQCTVYLKREELCLVSFLTVGVEASSSPRDREVRMNLHIYTTARS